MNGFLRAFTLEDPQIWVPVKPPGIWLQSSYVHIVPAELSSDHLCDRRTGQLHEERQIETLRFHWLRPVRRDEKLVLEACDPYVPRADEIRTDAALVICSARLGKDEFGIWKFPNTAIRHAPRSENDRVAVVTETYTRNLVELSTGTAACCYVFNRSGELARLTRFDLLNVRTSRHYKRCMFDRCGERIYKWGHNERFWPWLRRTPIDPEESEIPDDIQECLVEMTS